MSDTITEYPDATVYDKRGFYYVPFVSTDGRVGYRVSTTDGTRETFIYMNPSDGGSAPTPDVFVYEGIENDPTLDASVVFVVPECIVS